MALLKSSKNFGAIGKHSNKPKFNQTKDLTVIQRAEEGKTLLCVACSKGICCGQPGSEVPAYRGMMLLVRRCGCEDHR